MTDRELMQQALDALHVAVSWGTWLRGLEAVEALRNRLAQPEQEPVAWRFKETKNKPWSISDDGYYISCKRTSGYIIEPLYTTPPQRKQLTDEEIADEWEHVTGHNISHGDRQEGRAMYISPDEVTEFARAVIAKATGAED